MGALHNSREYFRSYLAKNSYSLIQQLYETLTLPPTDSYSIQPVDIGRRRLRNILLNYICANQDNPGRVTTAYQHYVTASGMTDKMAALSNIVCFEDSFPEKAKVLQSFYADANSDPLVINKWFAVQALADSPNVLYK